MLNSFVHVTQCNLNAQLDPKYHLVNGILMSQINMQKPWLIFPCLFEFFSAKYYKREAGVVTLFNLDNCVYTDMLVWLFEIIDLIVSSQKYAGSSSFLAHDGGQEVSAHAQYSIDPISSPFDV